MNLNSRIHVHSVTVCMFEASYAEKVMETTDSVIVLASRQAARRPLDKMNPRSASLSDRLPQDVLMIADIEDIWLRDFSPARMSNPVSTISQDIASGNILKFDSVFMPRVRIFFGGRGQTEFPSGL
ncbi:MAG: hypothetical protein GY696_25200, partial [Gammaproteobacteria bacterium]|nr:hypothetical protein [Gammaproteobacteria bacterium]